MHDDHEQPSSTTHELIRSFRQLKQIPWASRSPIENCTQSETMMLFFIRRATRDNPTGVKASELGSMLNVASPTITQSVNMLVAKGLLQRHADPYDRRAARITLTEEGARLTALAHEAIHARMNALISHLGSERVELLIGLLDDVFLFFSGLEEEADAGAEAEADAGVNGND